MPNLRSWRIPSDSTKGGTPTIRQLLTHTSGLEPAGFNGYPAWYPAPSLLQVLQGAPPATSAAVHQTSVPGGRYRYSGAGYVVLQAVMTEVEGRPFQDIVADEVFAPLGMSHSSFSQPLDRKRSADAAAGHLINGRPLPGGERVYPELVAAGLWTTPTDLARFLVDLQESYRNGSGTVLSQQTAREMVTPTSPEGMGMGLLVTPGTHWRTVEHGGLNEGFKSRMVANLDKGYGAVVMTNGEQGAALANEILRAIAVTEGWEEFLPRVVTPLPLDAASLAEYAGTYSASPLGVVTCVVRDEHLVAVEAWGEETALVPVSDDTFVSRSGSPEYHFLRDAGGGVQAVELRSGSGTQRLFRSGDGASTALGPLMKGDVAGAADVLESTPGEGVAETGPLWAQIDDLAYRVLRGGFPERALLLFRFNARTYPENAVCQYGLADLYLKTGEIDRAREQFTRTLDVGREHPEVNARFAGLLRRAQEQLTMLRRGP